MGASPASLIGTHPTRPEGSRIWDIRSMHTAHTQRGEGRSPEGPRPGYRVPTRGGGARRGRRGRGAARTGPGPCRPRGG
jgi:hypothetical protein